MCTLATNATVSRNTVAYRIVAKVVGADTYCYFASRPTQPSDDSAAARNYETGVRALKHFFFFFSFSPHQNPRDIRFHRQIPVGPPRVRPVTRPTDDYSPRTRSVPQEAGKPHHKVGALSLWRAYCPQVPGSDSWRL